MPPWPTAASRSPHDPTQTEKLLAAVDRDLRNHLLFDKLLHPTRKDRLMLAINNVNWKFLAVLVFGFLFWCVAYASAAEPAPACPNPGEKCKVLYLTQQEEKLLMSPNGVLDTAAQARALDLGQFAVYFKTRIAAAVQGTVVPVKPAPDNNVAQPADKPVDNK